MDIFGTQLQWMRVAMIVHDDTKYSITSSYPRYKSFSAVDLIIKFFVGEKPLQKHFDENESPLVVFKKQV